MGRLALGWAIPSQMVNREFWQGRRVFLTGHTGFKGGWLSAWLLEMGAHVSGYALPPEPGPGFFSLCGLEARLQSQFGDILDAGALTAALEKSQAEIVFHLAAQPLVRRSYAQPAATFATNVLGTVNLLESVRSAPAVRAVVVVTSDKCYEDQEWVWGYRETDPLGGHDPYSASKACAELVTASYRSCFFEGREPAVGIASARAGNVFGGGDWAEDRLVPDAIRAIAAQERLAVRNPGAIRAWQHVLDAVGGYLLLAERLRVAPADWSRPFNFGPREEDAVPVAQFCDLFFEHWQTSGWQDVSLRGAPRETVTLRIDATRARHELRWRQRLLLPDAIRYAVDWYRSALASPSADAMFELSRTQIRNYMAL